MQKKKKCSIFQPMYSKKYVLYFFLILNQCGTNPKSKLLPLIVSNVSTTTPQFLSISPITGFKSAKNTPEFLVRYYITNQESQFVGYNLYINEANTSSVNSGSVYKPNGIEPSFPHTPNQVSTAKSSIQVKKVLYRKSAPSPTSFQTCKMYSFTFKAILSNSNHSSQSQTISRCSVLEAKYCTVGSSCNPTACTNSSCSESQKLKCPVGTKCNPCLYKDNKQMGCVCPEGKKAIGCYL